MSGKATLPSVDRRAGLTGEAFNSEYVSKGRPVIIAGAQGRWKAHSDWSPEYFASNLPDLKVLIKEFTPAGIEKKQWKVADYVDYLCRYEQQEDKTIPPLYCHDIPIFHLAPDLAEDIMPFPLEFFPDWYHEGWWRYIQFFMGPSRSLTPLHFDCLLTHNLFFQVFGRKRFTLVSREEWDGCYRKGWRWFEVDPEQPDYERHPRFKQVSLMEALLQPGDILYMPPGMAHHVRSLDRSISFNIDWHTPSSAVQGVMAGLRGMPRENIYYNSLVCLGLFCKLPSRLIFPFYKSYLNYVS